MNTVCPNIDYCGIISLLRQMIQRGVCTDTEARKIAARLAVQYKADIIITI